MPRLPLTTEERRVLNGYIERGLTGTYLRSIIFRLRRMDLDQVAADLVTMNEALRKAKEPKKS